MIKVLVDEGHALDMLAILQIKIKSIQDFYVFSDHLQLLKNQLGNKIYEIRGSEEYRKLISVNQKVFDLIEEVCSGTPIDALVVHRANMERFEAKKALQQKFFNSELTEKKTV